MDSDYLNSDMSPLPMAKFIQAACLIVCYSGDFLIQRHKAACNPMLSNYHKVKFLLIFSPSFEKTIAT